MKKSSRTASILALAIATASSGAYSAQLEEIIVTAQKRAESLQDVPISMTALDGKELQEAGVRSFKDMSAYVPNLAISENAVNTIITMRGISIGGNQSFEQSVGIFVDGVSYGKSRQIRTGLFDMGQVEVLRGPQGILFGKNTLVGAINVTTAEPTMGEDVSGDLAITRESNDGETYEGDINFSPTDNMAVRLAFRESQNDGYLDNGYASEANGYTSKMPSTDESMWRLTTMWNPTENTSIKFTHAESDHVRLGQTAVVTEFGLLGGVNVAPSNALMYAVMGVKHPTFGPNVAAGVIDPYRDSISFGGLELAQSMGRDMGSVLDKPEGTNTDTEDTALTIDIELSNGYTLTSVTGKNAYDYEDGIDADYLPVKFIGRSDISDYEQTSQEFRIASPVDRAFSFVAGAYWANSEQNIDRVVAVDGTLGIDAGTMKFITGQGNPANGTSSFLAFTKAQIAGAILGAQGITNPAIIGGWMATPVGIGTVNAFWGVDGMGMWNQVARISNWDQETDTTAVFIQGTYNITDDLSLTAGVRYTEEDKKVHAKMDTTASATGLTTPNDGAFLNALWKASFDSYSHNFNEERSTDATIPALNLQWKASDTSKFYISYSEGFKSGGFNAVDDQNPAFLADGTPLRTTPGVGFEFDDESAESFEIGGKHTLMDGAMTFNWAYFNSEYKDQQVSTFVGLGFVVANAASSEIQGLEVDMAWQATDRLRLGANVAFLDAKYGKFDAAGCTAAQASGLIALGKLEAGGKLTSASPVTSALGCQQKFLTDGTASGSSQDISGSQLSSDYNGSLTADYVAPMQNGDSWFVSVDVGFTDDFLYTGDMDPVDSQAGFEKVNVRAGVRGDNWNIMVFGRNVTDEITRAGGADVPLALGSHFSYMEPGSIWGARASYSF